MATKTKNGLIPVPSPSRNGNASAKSNMSPAFSQTLLLSHAIRADEVTKDDFYVTLRALCSDYALRYGSALLRDFHALVKE
jgi:hypothetical protein